MGPLLPGFGKQERFLEARRREREPAQPGWTTSLEVVQKTYPGRFFRRLP